MKPADEMYGYVRYVGPSHAWVWDSRAFFKAVENHLADGQIDYSRSHYTRNGRKITGRKWRRMVAGKS